MYHCLQPTMFDDHGEPALQPGSPDGHGPCDVETGDHRFAAALPRSRSPSDCRVRTPSVDSIPPPASEFTTWPAQMAYDAYHDADFTLASMNGVFQPSSGSGKHEGLVTRSGRGSSQGLIARPPGVVAAAARRTVKGGVFAVPGGLDYQDFSPEVSGFEESGRLECKETFADLVARANDWLRQNPQLIVLSCETITWSTSRAVEVGDTESMVRERDMATQNGDEESYCFSGLRLWVIPKDDSSNSSSLFSFPSSCSSSSSSSSLSSSFSASSSSSGCQRLSYRDYIPPLHSGSLSRLVDHANQDLRENPLPGRISTCETVFVPDFLSLDTGCLLWTETRHRQQPRKCVVFLRLFYIIGSITQLQMIGLKNIVPELVNGKYEPFSCLLQRATLWAKKEQLPLRITNFKSYTTPCNACSLEEEADRCSIIWPEPNPASSTSSSSHSSRASASHHRPQQHYFQVLRVFYVRLHPVTHDCTSDDAANRIRPYFAMNNTDSSCRTSDAAVRTDAERRSISCAIFSPAQTSGTNHLHQVNFERMRQTVLRIRAWSRTAGINIHSVESYASPLLSNPPNNHTLPELTYWSHPSVASFRRRKRKFLTHIRVYYDQTLPEPPRVSKLIAPNAVCPVHVAADSVQQSEEERKRRLKEGKWRKRKLHLVLSCIMTFAICIPAGGLFYLNALQTEWGKA